MATTVTKTIKSSGGDYTSLSAWEAGQQGDLVAADEIRQAECYSLSDTTQVDIDGWTTDATRYIRIFTHATGRHAGVFDTGKYNLSVTDANTILLREDFVRFDGLQFHISGATSGRAFFQLISRGASSTLHISNCIFKGSANTVSIRPYTLTTGSEGTWYIWNSIFYDFGSNGSSYFVCGGGTWYLYNCLGAWHSSADFGFRNDGATAVTMKNCYSAGSAGGAYFGTITQTTCASSDTTATGTGLDSIALSAVNFTNVTAGSQDFHLTSGSALKDVGTDLSGDATLPFSDDIDGQTRTGTWDVGPDEFVAATGGSKPSRLLTCGVN